MSYFRKRRERQEKTILNFLRAHPGEFAAWELGAIAGMKPGSYYFLIYDLEYRGLLDARVIDVPGPYRMRRLYSLSRQYSGHTTKAGS